MLKFSLKDPFCLDWQTANWKSLYNWLLLISIDLATLYTMCATQNGPNSHRLVLFQFDISCSLPIHSSSTSTPTYVRVFGIEKTIQNDE